MTDPAFKRQQIRLPVEIVIRNHCTSGAVEFENDWPGIFIRGDDCISLLTTLETHRVQCKDKGIALPYQLGELIECIGEYVVVKG